MTKFHLFHQQLLQPPLFITVARDSKTIEVMSLFVASTCQIVGDIIVNHLAWSQADQIAALSAYTVDENDNETNCVLFANNEGEMLANASINHDYEATIFDWHPIEKIVAIGWADGMVSCWVVDGKNRPTSSYSNNNQHNSAITTMKWNPYGKRLVTGDKKGVVCVWAVDARGTLNPIRQYKKKGSITALVYCILQPRNLAAAAGGDGNTAGAGVSNKNGSKVESKGLNLTPSFFFGTDRGGIIYADDLGHCTDVQQMSSPIDTMMFFEERSRLVIITRSLSLTQYHVSDDGRVARVMQVKLSVPQDVATKGIQSIVWAGPGLLAAATEEKIVRLFDIAADESYNLSLNNALGRMMDRSDRVVHVAFSPVDRYLAVGTQMGIVAIWKFTGNPRDVSLSRHNTVATVAGDWEMSFRIHLNSPVLQLVWHGGRGCLACVTEDGTVVLNESVLYSRLCGDLSVVQVSSQEVSLHMVGSPEPLIINTGMQMRGVAVGGSCFVAWSGKAAKIFRVDLQLQKFDALDAMPTSGVAMAIADASHIVDEAWFIAEASNVKICNFRGTQKGVVAFSEAEGLPQHVDVNGKFLAIVTNKGVIKIVDVHAPNKPKQLGGAGQFFSSKVNNDIANDAMKAELDSSGKRGGRSKSAAASNNNSSSNGNSSSSSKASGVANTTQSNAISADNTRIRRICVNSSGTMVAILTDHVEGALQVCHPDSKLHVYDRSKGAILVYDFSSVNRYPINIFWDEQDDRLISCEAQRQRLAAGGSADGSGSNKRNSKLSGEGGSAVEDSKEGEISGEVAKHGNTGDTDPQPENEIEVYLFFATSDHGILMQDSFPRKSPYGSLIGLNVPRLYFRSALPVRKADEVEEEAEIINSKIIKIYSKVMRDFVGMDDINETAKSALLDFSYYLTLGKLDEAYRVVKAIDSPSIWENMAQMCVKTKRLDVAEVCLGNMGHARGAAAVRNAKKIAGILEDSSSSAPESQVEVEVAIGVLAIQLGLLDDAANLFREASRFDMLNKLYQAAGLWDKAISTATSNDRIHLKTTHYEYARHLESIGQIDDAIEHYQLSGNSTTEVPRMLFHLGRVDELGDYVLQSDDPVLLKWWAAYLESIERYDKARKYYSKAKDYLSLVRICCFKGDLNKAAEIVQESGDRASAYHFARQLEGQGEYQDAIAFYASSGCYNHSIRLARAYNLDSELMRYALKSTPSLMIECAVHFEAKEEYDKAVQLYHKGGDMPRALDLCFRVGDDDPKNPQSAVLFDMLNSIAQDLGAGSSPQTLARCAEFLVQHKQFDKAIDLYVMAGRYRSAVEMCLQHKVNINDEMVEKLTPPETMEVSERKEILSDLAKALKKQGAFTLASKKYTQAGDRVRAIKCLVRSGDTKAVIQFASISRNVEIYKLAANYLQQMNWRESVDILKAIITFYSKAKAFLQLAGFYDSCAQVEIDEYRDYEKAIGALKEALKYLSKDNSRHAEDMAGSIEKRIQMIEKFVQAKKAMKKDPNTMVSICQSLLTEPTLEEAIRAGDCLAMLVEYFHGSRQMQDAYRYLREMEERQIQLHPYVDAEIIEEVFKAVGATLGGGSSGGGGGGGLNLAHGKDDDGDEIWRPAGGGGGDGGGGAAAAGDEEVEDEIDEDIAEEEDEDEAEKNKNKRPSRATYRGAGSLYYNRK